MSVSILECACGVMLICLAGSGKDEEAMAQRLAAKGDGLHVIEIDQSDDVACPECGREYDLYDGDFASMHPADGS
jgi:hypothetical protein